MSLPYCAFTVQQEQEQVATTVVEEERKSDVLGSAASISEPLPRDQASESALPTATVKPHLVKLLLAAFLNSICRPYSTTFSKVPVAWHTYG